MGCSPWVSKSLARLSDFHFFQHGVRLSRDEAQKEYPDGEGSMNP